MRIITQTKATDSRSAKNQIDAIRSTIDLFDRYLNGSR